jgi:hypothetical protein
MGLADLEQSTAAPTLPWWQKLELKIVCNALLPLYIIIHIDVPYSTYLEKQHELSYTLSRLCPSGDR